MKMLYRKHTNISVHWWWSIIVHMGKACNMLIFVCWVSPGCLYVLWIMKNEFGPGISLFVQSTFFTVSVLEWLKIITEIKLYNGCCEKQDFMTGEFKCRASVISLHITRFFNDSQTTLSKPAFPRAALLIRCGNFNPRLFTSSSFGSVYKESSRPDSVFKGQLQIRCCSWAANEDHRYRHYANVLLRYIRRSRKWDWNSWRLV